MLLALCLLWSILGFIAEVSGELTTQQRIAHLMVIVMFAIFVVLGTNKFFFMLLTHHGNTDRFCSHPMDNCSTQGHQ